MDLSTGEAAMNKQKQKHNTPIVLLGLHMILEKETKFKLWEKYFDIL